MSQFFTSSGQNIRTSASVFPMNIQGWFPLGLTGLISLQSKGLSRIFSNTIVQKHQFFTTQLSLWSSSHIHTWLLEKTIALTIQTCVSKVMSLLFNMLSRFVIAFLLRSKCCVSCMYRPKWYSYTSVQFSSVAQLCLTLCGPVNHGTPGLHVHHQFLESTQTHVHWVGDAIQPSHSLSSPSAPALNLSQHQGLFKWVSSLHQVAKLLVFQLQHQSFQ